MPEPEFIYQHPSDDLAKLYTPVLISGTVDPNYPLSNLSNDNPALPVKFTTDFFRLAWNLTTAQLVALLVLLHTNLRVTATVTIETNTTNSWPGTVVDSVAVTEANGLGYRPNPFLDRSSGVASQWVSLAVSDNVENIVLGGVWLGSTFRALPESPAFGVSKPEGLETVVLATNMGVRHKFRRAPMGGVRNGTIVTDLNGGYALIKAWAEACGFRASAVPIVFDSSINAADFVEWDQDELVPQYVAPRVTLGELISVDVAWRIVSPGEAWT